MKIKDLFVPLQGNGLELINLDISEKSDINFVSRTAQNNGVVAQVEKVESLMPFDAGLITVALGGSVLSSFVQTKPFYTAYHIMVLKPKREMSLSEKLFYCMCIQANAYRYSYGRQANKTLKDLDLPNTLPAWVSSAPVNPVTTNNLSEIALSFDISKWDYFPLSGKGGIFKIEPCKCSNAGQLLEDGNDIDYIGAKKDDNGVMRRVKSNKELTTKGNCIIFICDGQGSVGYTNYIENDFIGSTTLSVGRNSRLNRYNALFLVAVLDRERYRYSFGRKYKTNLSKAKVLLPIKDNAPDWDYMESYIKSLPYGDRL